MAGPAPAKPCRALAACCSCSSGSRWVLGCPPCRRAGLDCCTFAAAAAAAAHTLPLLRRPHCSCMQARHGIPVSEQLLTTLGGRPLQAATLAASGVGHGSTVQLLLRLRGGKGGFGALLRGQGRDGKITDNFDACRDLSGRRVRQVEAEKKLKQWEQDAKERELEKLALKHMKDMARQAKKDRDFQVGWTGGDVVVVVVVMCSLHFMQTAVGRCCIVGQEASCVRACRGSWMTFWGVEQPRLASSWHSPLLCTAANAHHTWLFAVRLLMLLQVNVEEVKREHKEAADRVVEAVHTALAEGLHQQHKHNNGGSSKSSSGDGSSGSGSAETAAAVDSGAAAAGSKRKQDAAGAAAATAGGVPKKRKPTMLDLVEGSDSEGSEDDSDAE